MALGSRVGMERWLCRSLGLILVRRSEKLAVVLVVPYSVFAAEGRIGTASWSCTGLGVAGEETGWCVQPLVQRQVDLCTAAEVGDLVAVASMTRRQTVC